MKTPMPKNPQAAAAVQLAAKWAKASTDAGKLAASTEGLAPSTKASMEKALQAMRQVMKPRRHR